MVVLRTVRLMADGLTDYMVLDLDKDFQTPAITKNISKLLELYDHVLFIFNCWLRDTTEIIY